MKQRLRTIVISLALVLGLMPALTAPVGAIDVFQGCSGNADTAVCKSKNSDQIGTFARAIINTMLFIIGIVTVIMIIIGGIRYTTSNGDSARITSAKNTILYAVIGLVVALLAYVIVNFVVKQFK